MVENQLSIKFRYRRLFFAIKALNQDKFEIHPIYITEQGQWVRGERIEGEVTDVEALK